MNASKDWLKASWQAGRDMLRASAGQPHRPDGRSVSMVPIRSLGPSHRERVVAHLLKLDEGDRYLRFGYAASDEQVRRYAMQLDFERDDIFGICNRRLELIAIATATCLLEHGDAEFGAALVLGMRGKGQVRHGDQLEPAVVDAEDVIALAVELHGIAADLLLAGGITEAQVASAFLETGNMRHPP